MRRMIALACVFLLLCGCAVEDSRLSQKQIDAYREEYPLCEPDLFGFDFVFPDYAESISRNNDVFTTCVAIVTVREERTVVEAAYPLEAGSAEEELANKMGESAIQVSMETWGVAVDELVYGSIPDYMMHDEQMLTIGSRSDFISLMPELEIGQRYLMTLTMVNPSWAADSGYPQELWDICEAGTVFYLTDSGHLLSSLEAYQIFDGIPVGQFCDEVSQMAQDDMEASAY